ncbi:MAG: lipoyl synthase [Magnetococcales bacterium]|nr:lipoyl synthase [Magnetococcales bacterium]
MGSEAGRKPYWLKVGAPRSLGYMAVHGLLQQQGLHSVCASAACPNRGECWESGTAAFMILGAVCTRRCPFCAVPTGRPEPVDWDEPRRLAVAARSMALRHVVITSVDRDDLEDGGAGQFVACVEALRAGEETGAASAMTVELLTPDFRGKEGALQRVLAAAPTVFNHNMETVERLYPVFRPAARYDYSLAVLAQAAAYQREHGREGGMAGAGVRTKSGIMLGLGESPGEVSHLLLDLRQAGVSLLTIGQYLQPSRLHHRVVRYLAPEEFVEWKQEALNMGFLAVESHPMARSSFHARQLLG